MGKKLKRIYRKKKVNKAANKIVTILLLVIVIYVGFAFIKLNSKYNDLSEQVSNMQQKIEDGKKEQEELNKQSEILNTDEYIEQKAREMGMVYGDEQIFYDISR